MKIAMLGHKHVPSREGGIEVVAGHLSAGLAKRGHQVTCYNRGGSAYPTGVWRGVRIKRVPTINRKGLAAVSSSVLGAFPCAFGDYDVVHIHAEGPALMAWLPRLTGKRVIVTVHGLDHKRAKWGRFASAYIMRGEKNAVRYAHKIIVLSKDVQRYFLDTYGRETVLIPNGVSRPVRCPVREIGERFGLEKDDYILFLARLVPEKGLEILIRAFRGLRTGKKLVIAGDDKDSAGFGSRMRQLAAGDDRILFTGFVEGTPLRELYSNAYLYCLPSDLEGMPLSLLEAMSYGNCCLVSDIAECTEVVGDHAPHFHQGDADDLKKKLQHLIDHPEDVEKYRLGAADAICNRFSWDEMTDRTIAVYQS